MPNLYETWNWSSISTNRNFADGPLLLCGLVFVFWPLLQNLRGTINKWVSSVRMNSIMHGNVTLIAQCRRRSLFGVRGLQSAWQSSSAVDVRSGSVFWTSKDVPVRRTSLATNCPKMAWGREVVFTSPPLALKTSSIIFNWFFPRIFSRPMFRCLFLKHIWISEKFC